MDPRRISKTGTAGLSEKHKANKKTLGTFQKLGASNGIELPRISVFLSPNQDSSTNQVIPGNAWTSIMFDYQETDDFEIQLEESDVLQSEFEFTAETAGFWVINSSATFEGDQNHVYEIHCLLNGNTVLPQSSLAIDGSAAKTADEISLQSNFMTSINQGDYIEMQVRHSKNDDVNLTHASFQAFRIGL